MAFMQHFDRGTYELILSGKLTFHDHPQFRTLLNHVGDEEVAELVVHLGEVDFIDSAGLGMMLLALDETKKHRKRLTLTGARGQVRKMFDMARFDAIFKLQPSLM